MIPVCTKKSGTADFSLRQMNYLTVHGVSLKTIGMTVEEFLNTLQLEHPPDHFPPLLRALWYEKKGDWNTAHRLVQTIHTPRACRIHAYLHRRNGDNENAAYWYQKARQPYPSVDPEKEWEILLAKLL
jgi:hypothetical protein